MNTNYISKSADDSILDVSPETRTVKACWSRIGNLDLDNDIIVASAFTKTIAERGPMGKNLVWSLIDHRADMAHTIGKPKELYIEGDMLVAVTDLVETEAGEDAIKLYEAGLINQHSIGFSTVKSEYDSQTQIRTITELKLYEGSAVLWGANPETPTIGFKGEFKESKETLSLRLEKLIKAFRGGNFTDDTFALMEIQIKQIQAALVEIEVVNQITQPAQAVEPNNEEKEAKEKEVLVKQLTELNNLFKS
jgi:HK97 family phage prohead protease